MEVCGSVTGTMAQIHGGAFRRAAAIGNRANRVSARPRRCLTVGAVGGFSDDGHLRYYVRCGGSTAEERRKKMMKRISKDLGSLMMVMEVERVEDGGVGESTTVKEATEILMAELQKLRTEEKLMKKEKEEMKTIKKKKKEEEKRMTKMTKMKEKKEKKRTCGQKEDMSSSSSSESSDSSDSECEEISNVATLRDDKPIDAVSADQVCTTITSQKGGYVGQPHGFLNTASVTNECSNISDNAITSQKGGYVGQPHGFLNAASVTNKYSNVSNNAVQSRIDSVSVAAPTGEGQPTTKIEVCMGGKCKKSGALMLMEEFKKAVGDKGMVSGCKCLGKCKEGGPNVRVLNNSNEGDDASMLHPRNPLCIGVGLEDVEAVLSNCFGKNADMGLFAS